MGFVKDFILRRKFVLQEIYKAYMRGLEERRVTDICFKLSLETADGKCVKFIAKECSVYDCGVEQMNREIHDENMKHLIRQTVTNMLTWWNRNKEKNISELLPMMEKSDKR